MLWQHEPISSDLPKTRRFVDASTADNRTKSRHHTLDHFRTQSWLALMLKSTMADGVSSSSRNASVREQNARDLADLNESYRRKRAEIVKNNERELKELRQNYHKQLTDESDQGEAAVNHIRKETRGRIANERAEVLNRNRNDVENLSRRERADLQRTRDEYQRQLERQHKIASESLKHQHETAQETLNKERVSDSERLDRMKTAIRDQYTKEKEQGENRYITARKEDDLAVKKEIDRGTHDLQHTSKRYDDKINETHRHGEHELAAEKTREHQRLDQQDLTFKTKIEKKRADDEMDVKKEAQLEHKRLEEQHQLGEKALKKQSTEFQRVYETNDTVDRGELENQHDRYIDAVLKQKQKLFDQFGKYDAAKNDPFYRMQDLESHLDENSNFYILKTKVPEYEKGDVQVYVERDKAVVSCQRGFHDRAVIKGRTIASNSEESFHEIIPLKHPVIPNGVEKSYENGFLVVRIPKVPISE